MAVSSAASRRAQSRVGTLLNEKWRLDALLGIGGMATVYAATHKNNGKRAAVKLIHPELAADATLVARFLREGYLANRVDLPGVVSVLDDSMTVEGISYLVMELLDGYSLERHTRGAEQALPLASVLRIADELLDVLAAAHAVGIVHRDIKPANLFLTQGGRIKVLDFGIARLAETAGENAMTQTGAAIGTPAYMPPEQARGRSSDVDARTDLWAVGATMLALLLGQRPRRAETVQEELLLAMTEPMPAAASLVPALPESVARVIDCAVAFDRERRFVDARAMQVEIRRAGDLGAAADSNRTLVVGPSVDTAPVMRPGTVQPQAGPPTSPTSPSSPSSPSSASHMTGDGGTLLMTEPQQATTGHPKWIASTPAPGPARGSLAIVALVSGVLTFTVAACGFVWWRHHARYASS
jgi:serine/threonine-protein kinase